MRRARTSETLLLGFLTALLPAGCRAAIGFPAMPPVEQTGGSSDVVRICAIVDSVPREETHAYVGSWNREHTHEVGIPFQLVQVSVVSRLPPPPPGRFHYPGPLREPCDRQLAFSRGRLVDYALGIAAMTFGVPIVLGVVDHMTGTAGYVQTSWVAAPMQLAQMLTPTAVAHHELWHRLGCAHARTRRDCYERVRELQEGEASRPG